jgi:glycerol-3-phosphate dehydrogenase (NAD(P)+)
MEPSLEHFGIVGGGAWGTALALLLRRAGRQVTMWMRNPDLVSQLVATRENVTYLPGVKLEQEIIFTSDMTVLSACDVLVLAVPAQQTRSVCQDFAQHLRTVRPIISTSKGIELQSCRLMSEVVNDELHGHPVCVLSGPSFAVEIARDLPLALTLAGGKGVEELARAMASTSCRLYTTDDAIGAQVGGAIKNVLAIGCGIVAGRALGENARAALMTRGLSEITRLGLALGGRRETLTGLSGFGDVVSCCSSTLSRNMTLGMALGRGKDLSDALANSNGVTEGVATAEAALGLAQRHKVEMPIVAGVDAILRNKSSIDEVILGLLKRPLRHEAGAA